MTFSFSVHVYILLFLCTGIVRLQTVFEKGECKERSWNMADQQLADTQRLVQRALQSVESERRTGKAGENYDSFFLFCPIQSN